MATTKYSLFNVQDSAVFGGMALVPLPVIVSGSVTQSLNRPQRERLPCFEAGISVVKKVKLTLVTETGGQFVFSEGESVE